MTQHKKDTGFTLVELMLAMAFVGVLLVAIAITTIHIMGTYTKGLTVREVNQAGRTISEDIQRTIATSAPFKVSSSDSEDTDSLQYVARDGGGRLCTGFHTYAWNYGFTPEMGGSSSTHAHNMYADGGSDSYMIRFAKVSDVGGALCLDPGQPIIRSQAKELLAAGDRNLAIQSMEVSESVRDDASGQAIYAISFVLATNNSDDFVVLNPSNSGCLPPKVRGEGGQASDNEAFCAINKFNIIARAGNRSGSL